MFEEKKPEEMASEEQASNEPVDMFAQEGTEAATPDTSVPMGEMPAAESGGEQTMEEYEDVVPHAGKKHMILALIGIIVLVLVIGGGISLVFLLKPKQEAAPTGNVFPAPSEKQEIPKFSEEPTKEEVQPTEEQPLSENPAALPTGEDASGTAAEQRQDTTPVAADTDGDGLSDEDEAKYKTDPNLFDTDGDGLSDREELQVYATNPSNADSDGDGFLDGEEVRNGYDPNGSGKLPATLP
ncbi:hypothetical protein HY622_02480 [Candidatus Uhrbacteria bacterium]|nr:hypothetical protein [Candidatus Uhrbacteria bacterium]